MALPDGINTQVAGGMDGSKNVGVITGLVVRDPQSATLTTTIEGGWIRLLVSGRVSAYRIADTSKAFTASKDTWVYVSSAGALGYIENTLNDPKPSQATVEATGGAGSQLIAKVVTDGARVTDGGVTDHRQFSGVDLRSFEFRSSFAATEVGAYYWVAPVRCRIWKIQSVVEDTLAATDAATVTAALGLNDKYTNMTNGATSMAASSATGFRASALPSDNYIVNAGQSVRFTGAKATAGGNSTTQVLWSPA